jgi:hypothetical protein
VAVAPAPDPVSLIYQDPVLPMSLLIKMILERLSTMEDRRTVRLVCKEVCSGLPFCKITDLRGVKKFNDKCDSAGFAAYGMLDELIIAHAVSDINIRDCFYEAARNGHLNILEWLMSITPYRMDIICINAAIRGHAHVLEWARDITILEGCHPSQMWLFSTRLVEAGKLEPIQLAFQYGCTFESMLCSNAAKYGHLQVLQWARANHFYWDETVCSRAAYRGDLEMLQWAHENGCPWGERTCSSMAGGGHLNILQWARENGCPWSSWTCSCAAAGGHLNILEWLRENGCPWDFETCNRAAAGGHLNILKWAIANGCRSNNSICYEAASNGHIRVLQWAFHNGYVWDHREGICKYMAGADRTPTELKINVIKCALANGYMFDVDTCSSAAAMGDLVLLKWLREKGCPWDETTCSNAAHAHSYGLLEWAQANGCPWSKAEQDKVREYIEKISRNPGYN